MNDATKISEKASAKPLPGGNALYARSIASLRVLISGQVDEVTLNATADREAMTLFKQRAILIGGAQNKPFEVTSRERTSCYTEGVYAIGSDSVRVDRYNRLEFNSYGMEFLRFGDMSEEQQRLFAQVPTSIADFQ